MCECYTVDHHGADPYCPMHGANGMYERADSSDAAFERWLASQVASSTAAVSEETVAAVRRISYLAWQAAISHITGD